MGAPGTAAGRRCNRYVVGREWRRICREHRPSGDRGGWNSDVQTDHCPPGRYTRAPSIRISVRDSFIGIMRSQTTSLSWLIILTGAAFIREREHGTIEHLLVMPVTPFEIMCAKIWANGAAVLAATALSLFAVVQGVLAIRVSGSVPLFLVGAGLYLFAGDGARYSPGDSRTVDAAVRPAVHFRCSR